MTKKKQIIYRIYGWSVLIIGIMILTYGLSLGIINSNFTLGDTFTYILIVILGSLITGHSLQFLFYEIPDRKEVG